MIPTTITKNRRTSAVLSTCPGVCHEPSSVAMVSRRGCWLTSGIFEIPSLVEEWKILVSGSEYRVHASCWYLAYSTDNEAQAVRFASGAISLCHSTPLTFHMGGFSQTAGICRHTSSEEVIDSFHAVRGEIVFPFFSPFLFAQVLASVSAFLALEKISQSISQDSSEGGGFVVATMVG